MTVAMRISSKFDASCRDSTRPQSHNPDVYNYLLDCVNGINEVILIIASNCFIEPIVSSISWMFVSIDFQISDSITLIKRYN